MGFKIFKFGGASVKDAAAIENLLNILRLYPDDRIVVVISAMGKTTNYLESLLDAYYHHREKLPDLMQELQRRHFEVARQLSPDPGMILDKLQHLFNQLNTKLSQDHSNNYDFDYDQIVSFGELLSTIMISVYLNIAGLSNQWLDARRLIRTDSTYREGRVDWEISGRLIRDAMNNCQERIVITQGFIGGTAENLTTTLGREGSDYSAAIFAYSMQADSVTIWKDVPGLLNADPKRFPDAVKLDAIPYEEAIELAYYGASIIHPKTLKPLQNQQIPLYVKSFFHPEEVGSVITDCPLSTDIPSYIIKDNQTLLTIFPKDFSFIAVDNLSEIFAILSANRVKINLMQNSALSFSVCTDVEPARLACCIQELQRKYRVKYNENMVLITIRHYTQKSIDKVLNNRKILIRQTSRATLQAVVK